MTLLQQPQLCPYVGASTPLNRAVAVLRRRRRRRRRPEVWHPSQRILLLSRGGVIHSSPPPMCVRMGSTLGRAHSCSSCHSDECNDRTWPQNLCAFSFQRRLLATECRALDRRTRTRARARTHEDDDFPAHLAIHCITIHSHAHSIHSLSG